MPSSNKFRGQINLIFQTAETNGKQFVDINSGNLHRQLGGYPGPSHCMPTCCDVMKSYLKAGDQILEEPLKGRGAKLTIRYLIPR